MGDAFKVLAEERGIGEVQFVGNLGDGLTGMHEFHFDAGDEGAVDPFLGSHTAGLADDGTQITLCETHAVGVIADLVLFGIVLVHELDKAVEDGLFARL